MSILGLSSSQQKAILEDLLTDIPVHFDFLFSDSHAEVISGKQEGWYIGLQLEIWEVTPLNPPHFPVYTSLNYFYYLKIEEIIPLKYF